MANVMQGDLGQQDCLASSDVTTLTEQLSTTPLFPRGVGCEPPGSVPPHAQPAVPDLPHWYHWPPADGHGGRGQVPGAAAVQPTEHPQGTAQG